MSTFFKKEIQFDEIEENRFFYNKGQLSENANDIYRESS